jgi:hypothetical protein
LAAQKKTRLEGGFFVFRIEVRGQTSAGSRIARNDFK